VHYEQRYQRIRVPAAQRRDYRTNKLPSSSQ
jgi:hypothetical protein